MASEKRFSLLKHVAMLSRLACRISPAVLATGLELDLSRERDGDDGDDDDADEDDDDDTSERFFGNVPRPMRGRTTDERLGLKSGLGSGFRYAFPSSDGISLFLSSLGYWR